MSVDYTPILAIGLEFDCKSEVRDFLLKHGIISEDDEEQIEYDGITEFMYNHDSKLDVECLNLYTGDYYFVGFRVYVRNVSSFAENVAEAISAWGKLFPTVPAELIHTVKVH